MSCLIDKEQTKEYLIRACPMLSEDYLIAVLNSIPSARPKGKWIDHSDEYDGGYYECSVCGEPWVFIEGTPKENNANFCPNCGAEMREDE